MTKTTSQYFSSFLTSEASLARQFHARSRRMAFEGNTREAAVLWQEKARQRLAVLLGLHHFEACGPSAEKVNSVPLDGISREEWRLQTEHDVWMPFYLFIPDRLAQSPGERAPLVLCAHGHGSAGKWATGGRRDIPIMVPVIERYNYDYGLQIARAGLITACPDARGFGQRRELALHNDGQAPDYLFASSCSHLTLSGTPLGLSVQGMWTWDLMQLLNFLERDERIDSERVGCAGLSGGGLQTLNLAALDQRVRAAVVSGYFYGVRESLQVLNANCMCNMVPHLWEEFDMGDIGALIAPRRLFIETGDEDPLNGDSNLDNVHSQVEISRNVFDLLGGDLQHHIFHGEHRWNGERSIPWLKRQLQEDASSSVH